MIRPAPLALVALLALTACAPGQRLDRADEISAKIAAEGQYWQRRDTTSAIWQQGPKAQQMLNRDIARCVTELSELQRLGQIKDMYGAPKSGSSDPATAQKQLNEWDSPERDGMLLVEPMQYDNFETCMVAKGWQRVAYVPYGEAARASDGYVRNHVNYQDFIRQSRESYDRGTTPATARQGYND